MTLKNIPKLPKLSKTARPIFWNYQGKQTQVAQITWKFQMAQISQNSKPGLLKVPSKAGPNFSNYIGKQTQHGQINHKIKPPLFKLFEKQIQICWIT